MLNKDEYLIRSKNDRKMLSSYIEMKELNS